MAAKKSPKVKGPPRKAIDSKKAANVKGVEQSRPRSPSIKRNDWTDCQRGDRTYFPPRGGSMTSKDKEVRDLPERKIPNTKADQVKGGSDCDDAESRAR